MILSARTRRGWIDAAPGETFDLLVVGGGITGAGVALDAASRGLRVFLAEKSDFASGTSSRSSKLIHGGLRYLRQLQPKVTVESARERERLRRLAPHLVRDLVFVFPVYRGPLQHAALDAALWAYDLAAGRPRGRTHRSLSPRGVLRYAPALRPEGLRGGERYHDAQADDARLVLHVLKTAARFGARVVNYAPVTRLHPDGAEVEDRAGKGTFRVRARKVVAAAGVWTDRLLADGQRRIRATKGAHLILRSAVLPLRAAVILPCPEDGRAVFAIPLDGGTLLGTTDTDYQGDFDRPRVDAADSAYLLRILRHYFPGVAVAPTDILSVYAGLRPLVRRGDGAPSKTPREHAIWTTPEGTTVIAGGKLTTYRAMAEEVVDRTFPGTRSRTARIPLFPAHGDDRWTRLYGSDAEEIRRAATGGDRPVVEGAPLTEAEARYVIDREMPLTPADVLIRRTRLALFDLDAAKRLVKPVAKLLGTREVESSYAEISECAAP